MAVDSQYTDSESGFKKDNAETWQPVGELAKRIVEKAGAK